MRGRWLSLSLVTLFAAPWSVALGVLGLWLLGKGHGGALGDPWIGVSAGIAALAAGQLVFLLCVAERVFPAAHALLTRLAPLALAATFLVSMGVLAVASLTRGV